MTGTQVIHYEADELDGGVAKLLVGISQLNNGIQTLKDETVGIDQEVTDQIETLLEEITGGTETINSFVSEKNTNIEAIQFVIKGESMLKESKEESLVKEEKQTSFWDKLVQLFQ